MNNLTYNSDLERFVEAPKLALDERLLLLARRWLHSFSSPDCGAKGQRPSRSRRALLKIEPRYPIYRGVGARRARWNFSGIDRRGSAATAVTLAVAAFCLLGTFQAEAQIITLEDRNSSTTFDLGTQAGFQDWQVDSVDHLHQQWFWYRVGASGGEVSLDSLGTPLNATSDTNPIDDTRADTFQARYTSAGLFTVNVTYTLRGGLSGSGDSAVNAFITVMNLSASPLDFHLFQYADYDLNGSPSGDSAQISVNSSTGLPNKAVQTKGSTTLSQTIVLPDATHGEVGTFPATRTSLNDGDPTTLSNNFGPTATGDATWAFQWDLTIAPGEETTVQAAASISDGALVPVPEPETWMMVVGGLGMFFLLRRPTMGRVG